MSAPKVLSVSVDQGAAATATLIAAVTGKKVQVVSFCLGVANGATGVKSTLQDITANTVRFTLFSANTTDAVVYSYGNQDASLNAPVFETAVGEGLELVTGAAALVAGVINYRYVD